MSSAALGLPSRICKKGDLHTNYLKLIVCDSIGCEGQERRGRWMATALLGWVNSLVESKQKCIIPKQPQGSIVKWVFEELAKGIFAADQIRKEANKKGLKCSRANFWTLVRNPVYCGKIFIPKFKDEKSSLAQGQQRNR